MKLKAIILCTSLSMLCGMMMAPASAADIRYISNGDWLVPSGWQGGVIPGTADTARMNWGDNTVTLAGTAPDVNRIQMGVDESGTLEINSGGSIATIQDVFAGNNGPVTGTLRVNDGGVLNVGRILWAANSSAATNGIIEINSGGTVNVASHLWLGTVGPATIDISGTLNQTGGILGMGTSNAGSPSGGTATMNILDGGLLSLNNIAPGTSIQDGSSINLFGSGQITLPGDFVGTLTNYANANKLSGNGVPGLSNLAIDFGSTSPGLTTVRAVAIPEPSSAALMLGVAASGLLLRRRRAKR